VYINERLGLQFAKITLLSGYTVGGESKINDLSALFVGGDGIATSEVL